MLKSKLSSDLYSKVTNAAASIEQVVDIVKNAIMSSVGPLVTAIASKLKSSKLLSKLEDKVQNLVGIGGGESDSDDSKSEQAIESKKANKPVDGGKESSDEILAAV